MMTGLGEALCLSWDRAYSAGPGQSGGKGYNLARLVKYGFRVPRGGVLTTAAYRDFISANGLESPMAECARTIDPENIEESQHALKRLQENILHGSMPSSIVDRISEFINLQGIGKKALAVRSSCTMEDSREASFAGIHESFLNVIGLKNVLRAIRACYASLWAPRALAYRRKFGVSDLEMQSAVVLMEMIGAKAAGVGFTCDPQTGREDRFVISANFGLGESVVSGSVDPDTYYLDIDACHAVPRLDSKKIGRKRGMTEVVPGGGTTFHANSDTDDRQVLSDREIERLGMQMLRIFESLGDCSLCQDVEWAFNGRDFFILQSRPVTSLPRNTFKALKDKPDIWSNGNYRDALPMVLSPLHRRLMKNIVDTILFRSFADIDYDIPEGFAFSRFFGGRLYCNTSALQWAYYDGMGMTPENFRPFWGGHQPPIAIEEGDPFQGDAGAARRERGLKNESLMLKAEADAPAIFARMKSSIEAVSLRKFDRLSDNEFISTYDELGRFVKAYSEKFIFIGGVGSYRTLQLMQMLYGYFGERTSSVLNALMAGGEAGITSADHGYRLMELAKIAKMDDDAAAYLRKESFDPFSWKEKLPNHSPFKIAFEKFLQDYGSRAVYELDIINARWNEDPSYLMHIVRSCMDTADIDSWKAKQREMFEGAWSEVADKIPSEKLEAIRRSIKDSRNGSAVREMNKSVLARALEPYRLMALALGRRLCRRGIIKEESDIFFCSWSDLFLILKGEWNGEGLRELVDLRKTMHKEREASAPPDVILGETPVYSPPIVEPSGQSLAGVGAAAGRAAGTARLIRHPAEGNRLNPGDVLVAPSTDPAWTPLFLKASAVVMETGGYLSHGSIVAREYGVPAVVNVPGAMKAIEEGRKVCVDGDSGKVFLL
jgi:pyruvate,water dikinase